MSDWWITKEMHGTIYYYYDKVLVTNCKLKTLEPYAGKVAQGCAVQMLFYSLEAESVPLSVPVGVSAGGDFYFVRFSENIIYQIHRKGTLIRAYAAEISQVEETIMDVPMAVLAMLEGRLLLRGTTLSIEGGAYAVLSEAEVLRDHGTACIGMLREDTILIEEDAEGYQGILCSGSGNKAVPYKQRPISGLKGILVLRRTGQEKGVKRIAEIKTKSHLLLDGVAGFSMFSQEMQEHISNSRFLKEAGPRLPVGILSLPEGCNVQDAVRCCDLRILDETD